MVLTHLFPMHPFSTPLKLTVFLCFQGTEKGCIGNKWVDDILKNNPQNLYNENIALHYPCFYENVPWLVKVTRVNIPAVHRIYILRILGWTYSIARVFELCSIRLVKKIISICTWEENYTLWEQWRHEYNTFMRWKRCGRDVCRNW